jgi:hypothetical protein
VGCINSDQNFSHWFSNIHLSGPCNRSCYFCIGQHMMGLDKFNNLNTWPLDGIDEFVEKCKEHNISEVNLTGTNTDPMLYKHLPELKAYLKERIPNLVFGIRTNGVAVLSHPEEWKLFDKGSITFPSFDPNVYEKMMGSNQVPDLFKITRVTPWPLKVNIVLSPYDVGEKDEKPLPKLIRTIMGLQGCGIKKVNLREPYGQPNVGDPLAAFGHKPSFFHLGMPVYEFTCIDAPPMLVCYWDVHYCEVESVNLYASGRVSVTYPITKGYTPEGKVVPQSEWGTEHKRHFEQWVGAEPVAWRSIVEE